MYIYYNEDSIDSVATAEFLYTNTADYFHTEMINNVIELGSCIRNGDITNGDIVFVLNQITPQLARLIAVNAHHLVIITRYNVFVNQIKDLKLNNCNVLFDLNSSMCFMAYLWIKHNLKKNEGFYELDKRYVFQDINPITESYIVDYFKAPDWLTAFDLAIRKDLMNKKGSDAEKLCNYMMLMKGDWYRYEWMRLEYDNTLATVLELYEEDLKDYQSN